MAHIGSDLILFVADGSSIPWDFILRNCLRNIKSHFSDIAMSLQQTNLCFRAFEIAAVAAFRQVNICSFAMTLLAYFIFVT